jgi:uncharacterized protein
VSASAIGLYGDQKDELLFENSPAGIGFLAKVTEDWEAQAKLGVDQINASKAKSSTQPLRAVTFRLGMVVSSFGGAMGELVPLFKSGMGAPLGSGKQWVSWIHIDDAVSLFCKAVEDVSMDGIYNAVAPNPVQNLEFSKDLAASLKTHLLPAVPAFILNLMLGDKSALVLGSQRVTPQRLVSAGVKFKFTNFSDAVKNISEVHVGSETIFYVEQYLPQSKNEVFQFFAAAENLEKITPPLLNFKITDKSTPQIEEGTLIDYSLKIHGVPVHWKTKILDWTPNEKFVDTQLKGPYSIWHHTHSFEDLGKGTLMKDLVRYKVPMGVVGKWGSSWLVKKDVAKIFGYRRTAVLEAFKK